jgi:hypothetical protein
MVVLSFFGSFFKKNGLVKIYLVLLYLILILEIATAVFSVVMFYRFHDKYRLNLVELPAWSVWVPSIIPIIIVACKLMCIPVMYDTSL